jgi:hypothetical protein
MNEDDGGPVLRTLFHQEGSRPGDPQESPSRRRERLGGDRGGTRERNQIRDDAEGGEEGGEGDPGDSQDLPKA